MKQASTLPSRWRLHIEQPQVGYHFAFDAFLLATFVSFPSSGPMIDLGTGCGVLALLLARRFPSVAILGLEIQKALVSLAHHNVVHNALTSQITIVQGDIRQVPLAKQMSDMVVCNPPYRRLGSGRLNPHSEKAIARHEVLVTLPQVVQAARHVLRRRGKVALIYPPSRLVELLGCLQSVHFQPCRLRMVHPTSAAPASLVLVEAVAGGHEGLTVLPPLFVYDQPGNYTMAMQEIFQGPLASL